LSRERALQVPHHNLQVNQAKLILEHKVQVQVLELELVSEQEQDLEEWVASVEWEALEVSQECQACQEWEVWEASEAWAEEWVEWTLT